MQGQAFSRLDLAQFEQVQPSRSGLVVADESLRFSESACHVHLANPGLHPKLAEHDSKAFCCLLFAVSRGPLFSIHREA